VEFPARSKGAAPPRTSSSRPRSGHSRTCQFYGVADDSLSVTAPRLFLNHIANFDWLIALEFGRVDDAQPPENWRGVTDSFGFLHDGPSGREVGFKIVDFSQFDPDDPEVGEIWDGPRFDAPVIGLRAATAGEIIFAARALFGDQSSINRQFFSAAIGASGEEALALWLACLQAGDAMAHFGLGYTLYDLGRFQEAYRHLRHYTEIAPCGSWNWCWFGKAAEAVGEAAEARAAYERALKLEKMGDQESDAGELLARLDDYAPDSPPSTHTDLSAKHLNYWDYDRASEVTCPSCGWSGAGAGNESYFDELLDVRCPECETMLLIVAFPTLEETRAAAAAGNPLAQAELPNVDARRTFLSRAQELELNEPSQLPDLEGDALRIDWDLEERGDERWTVLRHEARELWRELAYYEGYERFGRVFELLRERYGARLAEVRPTPASELYLYGDKLSAPNTIDALNASLKRD
jgi:tetratricopeptide (TPR) repeat protein